MIRARQEFSALAVRVHIPHGNSVFLGHVVLHIRKRFDGAVQAVGAITPLLSLRPGNRTAQKINLCGASAE